MAIEPIASAIRITGNRQDAEEVVQDAFWAVIRKIHPSGVRLLALVIATPLVALSAPVALAQPATAAAVLPLTASPPVPRIAVDAPLAESLSRGVVFIRYRTEDLLVVPVFGPKALKMSPAIGHLHVALDGARGAGATPAASRSSSLGFRRGRTRSRSRS
jgi:Family of unknown function (DUF6130)